MTNASVADRLGEMGWDLLTLLLTFPLPALIVAGLMPGCGGN